MAELNTAEVEAKADAAFATGFGDTPPAPAAMVVVETPAEPVKPAPAAAAPPKPEKPEYVRVTRQEWDNSKAALGKIPSLESALAKLTGSVPTAEQISQQVLEKVRAQTPAGLNVELSDEDFAEMVEYAPELATVTRAALEKIFKKAGVKGTGTAEPEPAKTEASLRGEDVDKAVEKALRKRDEDALVKAHPTWSDDVGRPAVDGGEIAADNPFRIWLATQSPEYQKEVGETDSWAVVHAALDKFKASQKEATPPSDTPAKPDKAAARRAVMSDAVTPRVDGNPPPVNQPMSAEEAFGSAFKAAKRH